jgi:hypothetical protein
VRTLARYTGAVDACDLLDLWWKDRAAVIGPICRLIGRSGWAELWSGVARCTKARYTGWRGATGSNLGIFQGLRCVWVLI